MTRNAHVIASDAEAIAVAERLAQDFAPGASRRDRDRVLPWDELDTGSGELVAAQPTYRPWSQSSGFGVRMRADLDAIRAQRRAAALRLRQNIDHALDALGAVLINDDGTPAAVP